MTSAGRLSHKLLVIPANEPSPYVTSHPDPTEYWRLMHMHKIRRLLVNTDLQLWMNGYAQGEHATKRSKWRYLSEELVDKSFRPAVMQVPRLRRMTDVGAVNDQRERLGLVNAVHPHTSTPSSCSPASRHVCTVCGRGEVRVAGQGVTN